MRSCWPPPSPRWPSARSPALPDLVRLVAGLSPSTGSPDFLGEELRIDLRGFAELPGLARLRVTLRCIEEGFSGAGQLRSYLVLREDERLLDPGAGRPGELPVDGTVRLGSGRTTGAPSAATSACRRTRASGPICEPDPPLLGAGGGGRAARNRRPVDLPPSGLRPALKGPAPLEGWRDGRGALRLVVEDDSDR